METGRENALGRYRLAGQGPTETLVRRVSVGEQAPGVSALGAKILVADDGDEIRRNVPAGVDEYSLCRSVVRRYRVGDPSRQTKGSIPEFIFHKHRLPVGSGVSTHRRSTPATNTRPRRLASEDQGRKSAPLNPQMPRLTVTSNFARPSPGQKCADGACQCGNEAEPASTATQTGDRRDREDTASGINAYTLTIHVNLTRCSACKESCTREPVLVTHRPGTDLAFPAADGG